MSNITKETLIQTLPAPLEQDQHMHELGETAADAIVSMWANIILPAIYTRIDELPEDLLDILAKDFKVDWYDFNCDLDAKRALIKDSIYVHKHLGTAAAVKRALSDVWPASTVEEWFTYSGSPYHFRVILTGNYTPEIEAQARRAVNLTKNVRSILDSIIFNSGESIATVLTDAEPVGVEIIDECVMQ